MKYWKHLKYKNITLLVASLLVALLLSKFELLHYLLLSVGNFGYLGAFVAGALFASTFTVATGAVIILVLAEKLSLLEIGILAGLGGVLADFTIFRFVRDKLIDEVKDVYEHIDHNNHLKKIIHTKYFGWMSPVIGALIIVSPLPDELGVSLLGIGRMKTYQFLILSFVLNFIGIFIVVFLSRFIKP